MNHSLKIDLSAHSFSECFTENRMHRLWFCLDGTIAKDITVLSRWNLIGLCYGSVYFRLGGTVAKEITVPSNFFKFSPQKTYPLLYTYHTKNPLLKR